MTKSQDQFNDLFKGQDQISAQAYILGQRLNMKKIRDYPVLKNSPYMVAVGSGAVVMFRYGVVVLFGLSEEQKTNFLEHVAEFITQPHDNIETESVTITLDKSIDQDKVTFDSVHLKQWDIDRFLIIADVLAKSQVLSYHELQIGRTFDEIEPIALEMQKKGYPRGKRSRDLLRNIATTLTTQRSIAGEAEILDKPDFLWDKAPALQGLFVRFEDEYELRERHSALKEKLELIYRTSEMMLNLMNARHTLHVEWYIVILIVIEIFISIYEMHLF
ncbi:MAG: RMD1 family protein [Alphaproteobacteria bacterium]|nr:RMD1 family protein [Alphaproteobacteria bacterium]